MVRAVGGEAAVETNAVRSRFLLHVLDVYPGCME